MLALLLLAALAEPFAVGESPYGTPRTVFAADDAPPAAPFDPGDALRAPPVLRWRVPLPGGVLNAATHTERATPVLTPHGLLLGSAAGSALYLLDPRTGDVRRAFPASASVASAPLVLGDQVVFSDAAGVVWSYPLTGAQPTDQGADGAADRVADGATASPPAPTAESAEAAGEPARDGRARRRRKPAPAIAPTWKRVTGAPIVVEPVLVGDVLVVTTVDDTVYGLDPVTGEAVWRYEPPPDLSRRAELALYAAPPAVLLQEGQADVVLVGFHNGEIVALDPKLGDELWRHKVGTGLYPDLVAAPVVHERLILTSGYFEPLVALDRDPPHDAWWELPHGAAATPLLRGTGEEAVLFHPGTDGILRAVAAMTGELLWTWSSGSDGALTAPVWTESGLLVASSNGALALVDPFDGTARWTWSGASSVDGISVAPAVSGRWVFVVSNGGFLYALAGPDKPSRSVAGCGAEEAGRAGVARTGGAFPGSKTDDGCARAAATPWSPKLPEVAARAPDAGEDGPRPSAPGLRLDRGVPGLGGARSGESSPVLDDAPADEAPAVPPEEAPEEAPAAPAPPDAGGDEAESAGDEGAAP